MILLAAISSFEFTSYATYIKIYRFYVIIWSISFHGKSELRRQQEVDEDRGGRRKKQEESDRGMIKITKKVISVRGAHNQQDICIS